MREVMEKYAELGGIIAEAEVARRGAEEFANTLVHEAQEMRGELTRLNTIEHKFNEMADALRVARLERDQLQADLDGSLKAAKEQIDKLENSALSWEIRAKAAEDEAARHALNLAKAHDKLKKNRLRVPSQ